MESEKRMPEKKINAGAIVATVWKNQGNGKSGTFPFYSVQLERRYKDKDGEWKSTNSFRANDLPKAELVISKAFEFISMSTNPAHAGGISEEVI